MKDPLRLDEGDATAFEGRLLDAVKRHVPDATLKARMQQGLGLTGAAVPVTAVAKSFALGWKAWKANLVVACVAVGAAVAVPLALTFRDSHPTPSSPIGKEVPETPPATAHVPSSAAAVSAMDQPVAREENALGSLTEEIGLLDRVRMSMASRQPRRALAELQRYDERYPQGRFRPEAIVLRIEALAGTGDKQAARLLGQQFLSLYPKNPLADRVAKTLQH